jgi:hypothetical protein
LDGIVIAWKRPAQAAETEDFEFSVLEKPVSNKAL